MGAALLAALTCSVAHAQPADQQAFVVRNEAVQPPDGTRTPIRGIDRKIEARDNAVCAAKPSPQVRDWVGTVHYHYAEPGEAAIFIAIGRRVYVHEVLRPGRLPRATPQQRAAAAEQERVAAVIAQLSRGGRVVFSGRLETRYTGRCYRAGNLFIQDRHDQPQYSIRFSTIAPL